MGVETIIGLALAAGGTGLSVANQQSAARGQDRILAADIQRQARAQKAIDERLNEALGRLSASGTAAYRDQAKGEYLGRIREGSQVDSTPVPGANKMFGDDLKAAMARVMERGTEVAGNMARIDAPHTQRQREGEVIGRTSVDMAGMGRDSEGQSYLSRLRASGKRPNPWIDALASVMQGAGSGMAGKPSGDKVRAPASMPGFEMVWRG